MWGKLAVAAEKLAIPIDFVGIFGVWNEERILVDVARGWHDLEVAPVPRIACIGRMALRAEGFVCADGFPAGVIKGWKSPLRIVAQVKLPVSVDWLCAAADAGDYESPWRGGRRCRDRRLPGVLAERAKGQRQKDSPGEKAAGHRARIAPRRHYLQI